jgi:hypothetical protein
MCRCNCRYIYLCMSMYLYVRRILQVYYVVFVYSFQVFVYVT